MTQIPPKLRRRATRHHHRGFTVLLMKGEIVESGTDREFSLPIATALQEDIAHDVTTRREMFRSTRSVRCESGRAMQVNEPPKFDPREEHFRIFSGIAGIELFLRHLAPACPPAHRKIVLYLHGATFPSTLSIAHRFDGYSWRDDLNAAGFDVWGLDFAGFGGSDRYAQRRSRRKTRRPLEQRKNRADKSKRPCNLFCSATASRSCRSFLIRGAACPPAFSRADILNSSSELCFSLPSPTGQARTYR